MTSTRPCWPLSQSTVKQILQICGFLVFMCIVLCVGMMDLPLELTILPADTAHTEMGVCFVVSLVVLVLYEKGVTWTVPKSVAFKTSSGRSESSSMSLTKSDVKSHNSVIQACLKAHDFPRAEHWFNNLCKSGLQPDLQTYVMFLEASIMSGKFATLDCWLQRVREGGVALTKPVYDMLVDAYAKHGNITSAETLLTEMIQNGFPPSSRNYTTIVRECMQGGDLDTALCWVNAYKSQNPTKNTECSRDILNVWMRKSDSRDSEVWLEKMLAAGIYPNPGVCTFVICRNAKAGNVDRANRLYKLMAKNGIYPKAQAVIASVTACTRAGNTVAGKMWLERLEETDFQNPTVYRNVLSSYAKVGDLTGAKTYMMKMEDRGVVPDLFAHNSILHACAKTGDLDAMSHWLQVMEERNIKCDVIACNTVMNAYAAANNAAKVMQIFDEMRPKGMPPDDVSYAIAAKSCAAEGDLPKVEQLIEEMLSQGLQMRDHHLCALLLAHTNTLPWQPDNAEAVFRRAVASGVKVTKPVVIALARAVGWSRCNTIVGSRDRRRIIAQPHGYQGKE